MRHLRAGKVGFACVFFLAAAGVVGLFCILMTGNQAVKASSLAFPEPVQASADELHNLEAVAVETFFRITESTAIFSGTEIYPLYCPEPDAGLRQAELIPVHRGFLVLIYGQTKAEGSGAVEEGIVGRVWVDSVTGKPYHVTGSRHARTSLNALACSEEQGYEIAAAKAPGTIRASYLVEVDDYAYVWCFADETAAYYVDAQTGQYINSSEIGAKVQEILERIQFMPEKSFTYTQNLKPVFMEQDMHQYQREGLQPGDAGLCAPTSLAMLFDYWGEHIDKLTVADVATPFGGGTWPEDLDRAAMFSHNSDALWDHNNDGPQQGGYNERGCGYTTVGKQFFDAPGSPADEAAWEFLCALIDSHCPFAAHISGHVLLVVGYKDDAIPVPRWVSVVNPDNPDPDDWDNWAWEGAQGTCFLDVWLPTHFHSHVIRPMPVQLNFYPDTPITGQFTIQATVRTCHEYPVSGGAWDSVNRDCELKGEFDFQGRSENCPVNIDYPANVTKLSGDAPQYFDPTGVDDSGVFSWVFVQNGNEKGGKFTVTVNGWACDYTSTSYLEGQTDELFGWATLRIDSSLMQFKDAQGNVIAAFGDQGNVYLRSTILEWFEPSGPHTGKVLFRDGDHPWGGQLSESGNLEIDHGYHGNMDDVNDTCHSNDEQWYLNDSSADVIFRLEKAGDTIAYMSYIADLRIRGRLFENWTSFDYWD